MPHQRIKGAQGADLRHLHAYREKQEGVGGDRYHGGMYTYRVDVDLPAPSAPLIINKFLTCENSYHQEGATRAHTCPLLASNNRHRAGLRKATIVSKFIESAALLSGPAALVVSRVLSSPHVVKGAVWVAPRGWPSTAARSALGRQWLLDEVAVREFARQRKVRYEVYRADHQGVIRKTGPGDKWVMLAWRELGNDWFTSVVNSGVVSEGRRVRTDEAARAQDRERFEEMLLANQLRMMPPDKTSRRREAVDSTGKRRAHRRRRSR